VRRFFLILTMVISFWVVVTGSKAEPNITKLDPILRPLITKYGSGNYLLAPKSVSQNLGASDVMLNTIIKVSGDPATIRKTGARIRTIIGNLVTADVPISSLERLIALPDIAYIQSARKMEINREMETMLDVSVPETKADQVWNGTPGYTGKDTLVAVIDTGIDWSHPAFMDINGKSRILYIWDQTIHNSNRYPVGFMYGTEWTKEEIDAGICKEIDEDSHGTHVSSIAAGDEREKNGFTGMAPDANIIMVKSNLYDSDAIDAIRYILYKADSLKKPVVINMSFGSSWGPHDGTAFIDQALDEFLDRPGRAIVAAAGNSGGRNIHVGVRSLRQPLSGTYPWTAIRPLIGAEYVPVEIWYAPTTSISVRLLLPKNKNGDLSDFDVGWIGKGESRTFIIPEGPLKGAEATIDASYIASDDLYPNFNNIYIHVSNSGNLSIPVDDYMFAIEYDGAGSGFDAYVPYYAIFTSDLPASADFPDKSFLLEGDGYYSIISPASASKVISVASYITKSEWIDSENKFRSDPLKIGSVSSFSSQGPLLNGVLKPEIAAPGQMIVAAFSSDSWDRARYIYRDKAHAAWNGTSMSAPHVTGAIALMFQQNPNLDVLDIRNTLINTAIDQGISGWDRAWGYGKLNVLSAMNIPAVPQGFSAIASDNAITLTWQPNEKDNIAGYKIYSSLGNPVDIGNVISYKIENLANGVPLSISMSAYNSSGNESPKTREITITPGVSEPDKIPPASPKVLTAMSVSEAIFLEWKANTEYDINGYKIYYGNTSGNYDKSIEVGNVTEYMLEKLTNGTNIYITITAYDISGNESVKSDEVFAVPQLFLKSELRYQPGWPKKFGQDVYSSPAIYDIDGDGKTEIAITTRDGKVSLLRYDGSDMSGWPISTGKGSVSSPAICDVDGDSQADIIATAGDEVYVWHHDGNIMQGFPKTIGGDIVASPAVGDIDNDGEVEIIIGSSDNKVYAFKRDGTIAKGWPFSTNGSIVSSAAIGDIDGDSYAEIVIGSNDDNVYALNGDGTLVDGWPMRLRSDINSSPSISDINGDGNLEIIINSINGEVYVFRKDGRIVSGWPVELNDIVFSSPSIGNIDDDKLSLEIVICTRGGFVYVLKNDGSILDGFPVPIIDIISSSPALGDINNDGRMEIIVGSGTGSGYSGLVYALDRFGKKVSSMWPAQIEGNIINSSPALDDIDGDGDVELMIGSCRYWDGSGGQLNVWDLASHFDKDNMQWSQFRQNSCHTGMVENKSIIASVDENTDKNGNIKTEKERKKPHDFALFQNYPNPFNPGTWIPYELADSEIVKIRIYTANGKLIKTLDLGMKLAGSYLGNKDAAYWDGKDDYGQGVSSGIYFCVLEAGNYKTIRKMILVK
jgi:subtilisin family serine protease